MWNRGVSAYKCPGIKVLSDTRLTSDFRRLPQSKMSGHTGLTAQDHVIRQGSAARNSHLGTQNAMTTNDDVMRDLHEIIDFGSFADTGSAKAGPIHRGIRANLHIVFELNVSHLRHLSVPTVHQLISEPVGTDDHARMQSHPVTQLALRRNVHPGRKPTIVTHDRTRTDEHLSLQMGAIANHDIVFNHTMRSHRCTCRDSNTFPYHRAGMDSGRRFRPEALFHPRT